MLFILCIGLCNVASLTWIGDLPETKALGYQQGES